MRQASYCCKFPAFVGPKAVYTRPEVRAFLAEIRNITNSIVVWSSMKKSTVDEIAKYLFSDMSSPNLILGQESCERIEVRPKVFLMDQNNSNKMIFLKTLSSTLFRRRVESMILDSDNTLFIDDSPEKSVCNHTGNAIFLQPWRRPACDDQFLVRDLVPWLRRLVSECHVGQLHDFVNNNRIGVPPLAPSSSIMKYIVDGMALSNKNVGYVYDIPHASSSSAR